MWYLSRLEAHSQSQSKDRIYENVVQVQRCFTSTETIRTVRDGEPSTSTSTFTQLLISGSETSLMVLYIHRNYMAY